MKRVRRSASPPRRIRRRRSSITLNKEINAGLADPNLAARFADLGGMPHTGSPADFGKFLADETEKWAKVIRSANIKAE